MQQNNYQQGNNTDNSTGPDDKAHRTALLLCVVLHISTSSLFHASQKTLDCFPYLKTGFRPKATAQYFVPQH